MVSFPYYSHIFRDSYGSGMGVVWEAYHKGVPLLGVPEKIPLRKVTLMIPTGMMKVGSVFRLCGGQKIRWNFWFGIWVVPQIGGKPPKWMFYNGSKPYQKWMI